MGLEDLAVSEDLATINRCLKISGILVAFFVEKSQILAKSGVIYIRGANKMAILIPFARRNSKTVIKFN